MMTVFWSGVLYWQAGSPAWPSISNVFEVGQAAVIAFAAAATAYFTWTIRNVNKGQLVRTEEIERAYLTGGGGPDKEGVFFDVHVDNYGKTPAFLYQYAVETCDRSVLASDPLYFPKSYKDRIAPGRGVKVLEQLPLPSCTSPVVYGRFWYRDIWSKDHSFGFILSIHGIHSHPHVPGVSEAYTDWT